MVMWEGVTMMFKPNEWYWKPGVTLFAAWYWPVCALSLYAIGIPLLQRWMSNREPMSLGPFPALHNAFLSIISAIMLWNVVYELYLAAEAYGGIWSGGVWSIYTGVDPNSNRLFLQDTKVYYWIYIFYVTKYIELLDTVILVLKKRPVIFLHTWHHFQTLAGQHTACAGIMLIVWGPMVFNCAVHIIMYYYYFLAAIKVKVWWKKYVTSIQLVQFGIDAIWCMPFPYVRKTYFGNVSQDPRALWQAPYPLSTDDISTHWDMHWICWFWGCAVGWSFIYLFAKFYYDNYVVAEKRLDRKKKE